MDEKKNVAMTAEEMAEFEAFRENKRKEERARQRKEMRKEYAQMVDEEVANAIPELRAMSEQLSALKRTVLENFKAVLQLKKDVTGADKLEQRTHTFTTSDGNYRMTLGYRCIDGYRDTVEDGIAMVKQYIESLAKDDNSKVLVNAILRLLSRDTFGNIKASRVLQLRKMADESGDETFQEGVKIIEEAYQPTTTKTFITAECRDKDGAWQRIPLSMTDC